jgi:hypothetical protein
VLLLPSTSLEKEVLPVLRTFVMSRILPVPGRCESCYLGIFAHRPNQEAFALSRRKILRRPLGSGVAIKIFIPVLRSRTNLRVFPSVFPVPQLDSHQTLDTEAFIHPTEVEEDPALL